jgi:tetratricopeptide (TPR) repeat protein
MSDISRSVRTHLSRLEDARVEQARGAERLQMLPVGEWPAAIARDEALRAPAVLEFVLGRAKKELDSFPNCALELTTAVIGVLPPDPAFFVLRGRAMNTHAQAVHETGDVVSANAFISSALALLASDPAGRAELQKARIFAARIMHEQGDPSGALQLLQEAGRESEAMGNARVALQANMTQAGLLLAGNAPRDFIERAQNIFRAMLPVAEALGDEREQARILTDLGVCARRLGDADAALAYYAAAAPRFVALGMETEAQKLVWGMAPIAAERGQVETALAAFRGARDKFLENGALLEAALVSLDLLSLLLYTDRHDLVAPLAAELVTVFRSAKMPARALRAWTQLRAAVQRKRLDQEALGRARVIQRRYMQVA